MSRECWLSHVKGKSFHISSTWVFCRPLLWVQKPQHTFRINCCRSTLLNPWDGLQTTEGLRWLLPSHFPCPSCHSRMPLRMWSRRVRLNTPRPCDCSGQSSKVMPALPESSWWDLCMGESYPSLKILRCHLAEYQHGADYYGWEWHTQVTKYRAPCRNWGVLFEYYKAETLKTFRFISSKSSFIHRLTFSLSYKICSHIFRLDSWPAIIGQVI